MSFKYVTLERVADFIGGVNLDDTDQISELEFFITSAETTVEDFWNQDLESKDAEARPFSGENSVRTLFLPSFRAITSVEIGIDATARVLDELEYAPYPDQPRQGLYRGIALRGTAVWPDGQANIRVTANWGFPPNSDPDPTTLVPKTVFFAICLIVKNMIAQKDREDSVLSRSSQGASVRYVPDAEFKIITAAARQVLNQYVNKWRTPA